MYVCLDNQGTKRCRNVESTREFTNQALLYNVVITSFMLTLYNTISYLCDAVTNNAIHYIVAVEQSDKGICFMDKISSQKFHVLGFKAHSNLVCVYYTLNHYHGWQLILLNMLWRYSIVHMSTCNLDCLWCIMLCSTFSFRLAAGLNDLYTNDLFKRLCTASSLAMRCVICIYVVLWCL